MLNRWDSEIEVKIRISKARGVFASLKRIWKSSIISLGIFKSDVLSVLYSKSVCQKPDVFQNKCLRGILGIYWPKKISNYELSRNTCVRPVSLKVKQRRWRWIGM